MKLEAQALIIFSFISALLVAAKVIACFYVYIVTKLKPALFIGLGLVAGGLVDSAISALPFLFDRYTTMISGIAGQSIYTALFVYGVLLLRRLGD